MVEKEGVEFLHRQKDTLHTEEDVESAAQREGEESQKPTDKLNAYVQTLERVMQPAEHKPEGGEEVPDRGERNVRLLESHKKELYDKYNIVMDEDHISEKYWERQLQTMEDEGRLGDVPQDEEGNYYIPERAKDRERQRIKEDQEASFDRWVEYLASEGSNYIPSWEIPWILEGVRGSSNQYNEGKGELRKRRKDTVNPYPEVNAEALAQTVNELRNHVEEGENITSENFRKLYGQDLEQVNRERREKEGLLENTEGEWITYSDADQETQEVIGGLEGQGTGWCIAEQGAARDYLETGTLYIYYSADENGEYTVPRLTIHETDEGKIGEVRGISKAQNVDDYIGDVLGEKLDEFGEEGEKYQQAEADMKRLKRLKNMHNEGQQLSADDLEFLYERERQIQEFGREKDPRIEKIKHERDTYEDYVQMTGYAPEEISLNEQDLEEKEDVKIHVGNIELEGGELPPHSLEELDGDLDLYDLESAEGLELPQEIEGELLLDGLESAEGLELPQEIGGDLLLYWLRSAEGLEFPEKIGGELQLSGLESAKGLELPREIGESLLLNGLKNAEGLELPREIGDSVQLNGLKNAEGLELPREIGG
ncbi:MAG: hypothetical protein BRC23_01285, partial [Parcubacteria group bacterium SW_4_49_11]